MPSAVGATLQFGTPDPLNDFDDHLLPRPLFQLSMTLTMVTLVLQIYRIICLLIIYRAAVQEKSYWRRLGEEHFTFDAAPQRKNGGGVLKPPKLHSKKARMNLQMMNWLERLVDPLVSTFRGKTSVSLAHSTGSSLKTDMMVGGSSGGGDAFGPNNLNQPSIVATKSESDAQVINYLLRMKRDHECELCSISEDVDWSRFSHNMASQGFHLLGTALGLFAQMRTYNQIVFYLCGSMHICMSYGLTFHDSLGKLHLYGVLTRPDVCGYAKMKLVNESAVLIANLLLFIAFVTLFGFYIAFDDYISTLFHDHLLFIF